MYELIRVPGFTCFPLGFEYIVKDSIDGFSDSGPGHVVLDCQPGHWPQCQLRCSCYLDPVLLLQRLAERLDAFLVA